MVLTIMLGLTGCREVTLTNKTVNGLSFDVPDDFSDFAESEGVKLAANEDCTATIAVSATQDSQGIKTADWDKDTYTQTALSGFTEVNFVEFDTKATVSGASTVYAHFTAKSPSDVEVESYSYIIYIDVDDGDDLIQTVSFSFNKGFGGSLEANIDTVKNSLQFS